MQITRVNDLSSTRMERKPYQLGVLDPTTRDILFPIIDASAIASRLLNSVGLRSDAEHETISTTSHPRTPRSVSSPKRGQQQVRGAPPLGTSAATLSDENTQPENNKRDVAEFVPNPNCAPIFMAGRQPRGAAAKYTAGVLAGPQPVQLLRPCEFGGFRQHMNVLSTAARTRPRSRKRGPRRRKADVQLAVALQLYSTTRP